MFILDLQECFTCELSSMTSTWNKLSYHPVCYACYNTTAILRYCNFVHTSLPIQIRERLIVLDSIPHQYLFSRFERPNTWYLLDLSFQAREGKLKEHFSDSSLVEHDDKLQLKVFFRVAFSILLAKSLTYIFSQYFAHSHVPWIQKKSIILTNRDW